MISTKRRGEWFEMTIPNEWKGFTVDRIFREVWRAPNKQIHYFRTNKMVKVNGGHSSWQKELETHDVLQLQLFEEKDFGIQPNYMDINILFEDDHLLIANKPANINTHPNSPDQTDTLSNAVAYHLLAQGEALKVKHVHRLDRDTTGALLFAKHDLAGSILDSMLEERLIKRTYLALVHGILRQKKGTIHLPIGRDRHHATRRRVSNSGQDAITNFVVLKKYMNKDMTLIQCTLDTGRTHQIRAHLSHIGHPLVGDELYGGKTLFRRPALHAVKLELSHPFTKEEIVCHAPFLDQPPIFLDIDPYDV
ncbi:RluA family pseudouridine synthase [Bacillus massilinigeriensis]|uniref:RluA family pseudouridine synthase n=1 Tax=Bacillus massilionigeriensis TaxID=1805475 RepID=UPI00096B41F0|nr:RluA family pseudouridine synthase [Bacillus massilionigeriensis]